MNNKIEVGDTVRLVKGGNIIRSKGLDEDFVVEDTVGEFVRHGSALIPFDWFEIMKGKDEPDLELEEAMFDQGKFEKLKEDLHEAAYMYFTGEDTEEYALRSIRSLMFDYYGDLYK